MFKRTPRNEVVFVANGMLEAESVKILLESFGITAYTNQESAGTVYGLTVGPLGEVEVIVPPEQVDDARKIIAEMKAGNLEVKDNE
ncbi:MAG TPA: DUF2007 domain-containing protein [Anaerolineaceae bacterium]|jgi:hypothetical protein|nr:DUF2007 domain-containing protein [Chloroflexota bacterium]HNW14750.1 DUF2007 domain-containing protein [Anaerolineaceae bacterium]HOE02439.1 DUF2007 domain-containing protein [Anaerolineaceae bacterium]HPD62647.1 DUF2007 domain-containing protein [Anaerolineaceae bacterium]HQK04607.1 DUF2007 domain-containing protein [Anaerolineaceae bacterium]